MGLNAIQCRIPTDSSFKDVLGMKLLSRYKNRDFNAGIVQRQNAILPSSMSRVRFPLPARIVGMSSNG
jgi:hypothetical protein